MDKQPSRKEAGGSIPSWQSQDREGLLTLKDRALESAAEGITIADARLPDMPLIYVNKGFERLTGYAAESVLGTNCRFLQGSGTDPDAAGEIRRAVNEKRACVVEILNYRKDGTPFWNRLSITPIRDDHGQLTHFIGVQSDITIRKDAEDALRQVKLEIEAVNRRMKLELDMAASIQQTMLPPRVQHFEGTSLSWLFQPCVELAGDTLNVIPIDKNHIAFYIIDVSGHGVASALLSVTLNRWLSPLPGRFCAYPRVEADPMHFDIASPSAVARQLNQQFPMTTEIPQYFTMLFGILDLSTGRLRYVSAGHPGPIRVPKSGEPVQLAGEGYPIGLLPGAEFEDREIRLQSGDRIFLFTDGVVDAVNAGDVEFGVEQLKSAFSIGRNLPLQETLDEVLASVRHWCGDYPIHDDITLLGVEYVAPVIPECT